MDTSETYTKMCEKAEEIQKHEFGNGDYYSSYFKGVGILTPEYEAVKVYTNEDYGVNLKGHIWLPRQDQLQEMITNDVRKLCKLIYDMNEFGGYPFGLAVSSMEQLWLAFVMKEKYNKIWDGQKWIMNH